VPRLLVNAEALDFLRWPPSDPVGEDMPPLDAEIARRVIHTSTGPGTARDGSPKHPMAARSTELGHDDGREPLPVLFGRTSRQSPATVHTRRERARTAQGDPGTSTLSGLSPRCLADRRR
jgi:hypothetical protein